MSAQPTSSQLSVVIPLGPGEHAWLQLAQSLSREFPHAELIFSAVDAEPAACQTLRERHAGTVRWLQGKPGRAQQLNTGAHAAHGEWLWFLHADTQIPTTSAAAIARANPAAINYFELKFFDGPALMRLTQLGVALRCRLFALPFGDQGFLLTRKLFNHLGNYPEPLATLGGEDHALIWRAKQLGIAVQSLQALIATSARKYQAQGWLRVTLQHLGLTWRQARNYRAVRRHAADKPDAR
jgi:hypothetical protein